MSEPSKDVAVAVEMPESSATIRVFVTKYVSDESQQAPTHAVLIPAGGSWEAVAAILDSAVGYEDIPENLKEYWFASTGASITDPGLIRESDVIVVKAQLSALPEAEGKWFRMSNNLMYEVDTSIKLYLLYLPTAIGVAVGVAAGYYLWNVISGLSEHIAIYVILGGVLGTLPFLLCTQMIYASLPIHPDIDFEYVEERQVNVADFAG